jgi:drug/metabolite transporter superfamily protein YnfA
MIHEADSTALIPSRSSRGTVAGVVVLLITLTAAILFALATGDGTPSFRRAVAFTAAVCGVGAVGGWVISRWPHRNPANAVAGSLAAVFLRLAVPLSTLAWLQTGGQAFRAAGGDRLVATFYLLLLATDIVLNIMMAKKNVGSRRATTAN